MSTLHTDVYFILLHVSCNIRVWVFLWMLSLASTDNSNKCIASSLLLNRPCHRSYASVNACVRVDVSFSFFLAFPVSPSSYSPRVKSRRVTATALVQLQEKLVHIQRRRHFHFRRSSEFSWTNSCLFLLCQWKRKKIIIKQIFFLSLIYALQVISVSSSFFISSTFAWIIVSSHHLSQQL